MIDVHLPTTDGRELVLTRYNRARTRAQPLLKKLKLDLPAQPPNQNHRRRSRPADPAVVPTFGGRHLASSDNLDHSKCSNRPS